MPIFLKASHTDNPVINVKGVISAGIKGGFKTMEKARAEFPE